MGRFHYSKCLQIGVSLPRPLLQALRESCQYGAFRAFVLALTLLTQMGPVTALTTFNGNEEAPRAQSAVRRVFLMGTQATLQIYSSSRREALEQLESFIRIIEETEDLLSTWRPSSELSRINALPLRAPMTVSDPLCGLISTLVDWNMKTGGAFDPAVGSLLDTWDLKGRGRQPSLSEISTALRRSGIGKLNLIGCVLERTADVKLDAGAFGKGAALRHILAESEAASSNPWLIDFGGQIAVSGSPPGQAAWEVDLAVPGEYSGNGLTFQMQYGSVATSGSLLRDRWTEGVRIGHILDPRTGSPAEFLGSVTVWHEDPLTADVLSTALFVMGPAEGLKWAEDHHVAALYQILKENGQVTPVVSAGFGEPGLDGGVQINECRLSNCEGLLIRGGRRFD